MSSLPTQVPATVPRDVLRWIQSLDLSYSLKNIKRDLANGFLVAEIISRYHAQHIQMHSYENGHSLKTKKDNWLQLSKIFRNKISNMPTDFLTEHEISLIINCEEGAAANFICKLYAFLTGKNVSQKIMKMSNNVDAPGYLKDNGVAKVRKALQYNDVKENSDIDTIARISAIALENHERTQQLQRDITLAQEAKQQELLSATNLSTTSPSPYRQVNRLARTAPVSGLPFRGTFEDDRKAQQLVFAKTSTQSTTSFPPKGPSNNNQTDNEDSHVPSPLSHPYRGDNYYHDVETLNRSHTSPVLANGNQSRVRSADRGTREIQSSLHPNHKTNHINEADHSTASKLSPRINAKSNVPLIPTARHVLVLDYKNSEFNNYIVDMDKSCFLGWSDRLEPLENYFNGVEFLLSNTNNNNNNMNNENQRIRPQSSISRNKSKSNLDNLIDNNSQNNNSNNNNNGLYRVKKLKDILLHSITNIKFEYSNIVEICLNSKQEFIILSELFLKVMNTCANMDNDSLFIQVVETYETIVQEMCEKNNQLCLDYFESTGILTKIISILLSSSINVNGIEQYKRLHFIRILFAFIPSSNIQSHIKFIQLVYDTTAVITSFTECSSNDTKIFANFIPILQIIAYMESYYQKELYDKYMEYCFKVLDLSTQSLKASSPREFYIDQSTSIAREQNGPKAMTEVEAILHPEKLKNSKNIVIEPAMSVTGSSGLGLTSGSPRLLAVCLATLSYLFLYSFSLPNIENGNNKVTVTTNISGKVLTKEQIISILSHIQSFSDVWGGADMYYECKIHILSIISTLLKAMYNSTEHESVNSKTVSGKISGNVKEDPDILTYIVKIVEDLFTSSTVSNISLDSSIHSTAVNVSSSITDLHSNNNKIDDLMELEVLKYAIYGLAYATHMTSKSAQPVVDILLNKLLPQLKSIDESIYEFLVVQNNYHDSVTNSITTTGTDSIDQIQSWQYINGIESQLEPIIIYPISSLLKSLF